MSRRCNEIHDLHCPQFLSRSDSEVNEKREGTLREGKIRDGTICEGTLNQGTLREGKIRDETLLEGTLREGKIREGNVVRGYFVSGQFVRGQFVTGQFVTGHYVRGAGMVWWREHSSLTNVTKGSILGLCVIIWVEFVVGSLLCSERFFAGYSGFPLS